VVEIETEVFGIGFTVTVKGEDVPGVPHPVGVATTVIISPLTKVFDRYIL